MDKMAWDLRHRVNITLSIWVFFLAYELLSCLVRPHFWNDYGLGVPFRILLPLGLGGLSLIFSVRMFWAVVVREIGAISGLACGIGSAVAGVATCYIFVLYAMSV